MIKGIAIPDKVDEFVKSFAHFGLWYFGLNIFHFQTCTLQHINNTIIQRNRIGTNES